MIHQGVCARHHSLFIVALSFLTFSCGGGSAGTEEAESEGEDSEVTATSEDAAAIADEAVGLAGTSNDLLNSSPAGLMLNTERTLKSQVTATEGSPCSPPTEPSCSGTTLTIDEDEGICTGTTRESSGGGAGTGPVDTTCLDCTSWQTSETGPILVGSFWYQTGEGLTIGASALTVSLEGGDCTAILNLSLETGDTDEVPISGCVGLCGQSFDLEGTAQWSDSGGNQDTEAAVSREVLCDDGIDNDADLAADCQDSDCSGAYPCSLEEFPFNCQDSLDNDLDGVVDCADSDCETVPACASVSNQAQQLP